MRTETWKCSYRILVLSNSLDSIKMHMLLESLVPCSETLWIWKRDFRANANARYSLYFCFHEMHFFMTYMQGTTSG